jgi:hypothetical protein
MTSMTSTGTPIVNKGRSGQSGWATTLTGHLLLAGYLIAPRAEIERIAGLPSWKTLIMGLLNTIACVSFTTLGLLGILDGTEAARALLGGNVLAMSQFLPGPVLNSYLVLLGLVAIVGFFLPWAFSAIANGLREKASRQPPRIVLLASCYAVATPLAFVPIVHVLVLWFTWRPVQLLHLLGTGWVDMTSYIVAIVALLAMVASAGCYKKVAGFSTPRAIIPGLASIALLVSVVALAIVL